MIRAISAAITTLALATGALVFFSGNAPEPASYKPGKDGHTCQSSSYCRHGEAKAETLAKQR